MTIKGVTYTDKKQAGDKILELCKNIEKTEKQEIGSHRGFKMELDYEYGSFHIYLKNELSHSVMLGNDNLGNITRINNEIDGFSFDLKQEQTELENTKIQFENAKEECKRPFKQEQELKEKSKRLDEVNVLKVTGFVDEKNLIMKGNFDMKKFKVNAKKDKKLEFIVYSESEEQALKIIEEVLEDLELSDDELEKISKIIIDVEEQELEERQEDFKEKSDKSMCETCEYFCSKCGRCTLE